MLATRTVLRCAALLLVLAPAWGQEVVVVDAAGGAADSSMIVLQVDCYDPEADEDVAVPTVVYVPLSAHRR